MAKAKKAVKKEAKPKQTVSVKFILDSSGSMGTQRVETIQGFNNYIETLQEDKDAEYIFSLTLFSTKFEKRHTRIAIKDVAKLTNETYIPDGGTALYDAIGSTIDVLKKDAADKILVVIQTDGEENSSQEWNGEKIKKLIADKEKLGNWTFVYMGASPKAYATGVAMGVKAGNSYTYQPGNTNVVYASLAMGTSNFSKSAGSMVECFVPQSISAHVTSGAVRVGPGGQSMSASTKNLLNDEEIKRIQNKFGVGKPKK